MDTLCIGGCTSCALINERVWGKLIQNKAKAKHTNGKKNKFSEQDSWEYIDCLVNLKCKVSDGYTVYFLVYYHKRWYLFMACKSQNDFDNLRIIVNFYWLQSKLLLSVYLFDFRVGCNC